MNASEQYEKAAKVIPGGVNSSVRLNKALGVPIYVSRTKRSYLWDLEGNKYIDMCCAHGAALLGHAHPSVRKALRLASKIGLASMFETIYHEELARKLCAMVPCADRFRFCSSGSEATLHMIRACRAFTGRNKIIRIEGHFHGYHELIYIGGHPPKEEFPANRQKPFIETPGIPSQFADLIVPIPFNDPQAFEKAIDEHGKDTAVVILEPVNYNCACIKPADGYLELLRERTKSEGIVLFFDEVQSAFKNSTGGAQADYGVTPDVCTVGKSLGGGLPLSAFGGRAEIMDLYKPVGPVQHSGTFNAALIPVLAGIAFLNEASKPDFYNRLRVLGAQLYEGIDEIIRRRNLNMIVPRHGARFNVLLGRRAPAERYEDTFCHDTELMLSIWRGCWERGVYFHDYGGGPVHHGFSIQHTRKDLDRVLEVLDEVLGIHSDSLSD